MTLIQKLFFLFCFFCTFPQIVKAAFTESDCSRELQERGGDYLVIPIVANNHLLDDIPSELEKVFTSETAWVPQAWKQWSRGRVKLRFQLHPKYALGLNVPEALYKTYQVSLLLILEKMASEDEEILDGNPHFLFYGRASVMGGHSGVASLGCDTVMVNGRPVVLSWAFVSSPRTFIPFHEIGHNLGLDHALSLPNGWDQNSIPYLADDGTHPSIMSYSTESGGPSVDQLFGQGWIGHEEVSSVNKGTFRIQKIDLETINIVDKKELPLGLSIAIKNKNLPFIDYKIECRAGLISDLNSLDYNQVLKPRLTGAYIYLQKHTPNMDVTYLASHLTRGASFYDPLEGRIFKLEEEDGETCVISVSP